MCYALLFSLLVSLGIVEDGPPQNAGADLAVVITDVEAAGKGVITILLFDAQEKFGKDLSKAAYRADIQEFGHSARHTFRNLPLGTYAILAFQDLNTNGLLDKNFIGFPKESLVAYNMKRLSKPSFKKSSITLTGAAASAELKLLNQ